MKPSNPAIATTDRRPLKAELIVLLTAAGLIALFVALRYGGLWGETDTNERTRNTLSILWSDQLLPLREELYPNGFGFQAIAIFLSHITGLSLNQIQIWGAALMASWIIMPAWIAYRELTGTTRGATLATLFLFVQPEFLFVVMRGTHEKFTRGLMLLCIYLLVRSMRQELRPGQRIGMLLALYLASFAITTLNNLLAYSFLIVFGFAIVPIIGGWILRFVPWMMVRTTVVRMFFTMAIGLLLLFIVTFYIYPIGKESFRFAKSAGTQAVTVVQSEDEEFSPYDQVNTGWINSGTYLAVSLANWLLLGTSALVWMSWSIGWFFKRKQLYDQNELLLWAFYCSLGLQGAMGILVDRGGGVAGSLQHRIFPSIVMIAAPVVARWLDGWQPRRHGLEKLVSIGLTIGMGLLATLSMLKMTNEPLVSNKWLFVVPEELQAISWTEGALAGRSIWTEHDERILTAVETRTEHASRQAELDLYEPDPSTRDFLISEIIRIRSTRMRLPLPIEADSLVTYDNGQAQIYHLRPRTPYQR